MVIDNNLTAFLNSDLISGLANASQFYNIYQSTKAGTYAQMNNDLHKQTAEIQASLDSQTNQLLDTLINEIRINQDKNDIVIKQNEEILMKLDGIMK